MSCAQFLAFPFCFLGPPPFFSTLTVGLCPISVVTSDILRFPRSAFRLFPCEAVSRLFERQCLNRLESRSPAPSSSLLFFVSGCAFFGALTLPLLFRLPSEGRLHSAFSVPSTLVFSSYLFCCCFFLHLLFPPPFLFSIHCLANSDTLTFIALVFSIRFFPLSIFFLSRSLPRADPKNEIRY